MNDCRSFWRDLMEEVEEGVGVPSFQGAKNTEI